MMESWQKHIVVKHGVALNKWVYKQKQFVRVFQHLEGGWKVKDDSRDGKYFKIDYVKKKKKKSEAAKFI